MKTLYLIRHAQSENESPTGLDFDRELTKKGISDAELKFKELSEMKFKPGLLICSTSKRTIKTAEIISGSSSILYDEAIYEASLNDLIKTINVLPDEHKEIALIGHNPSITSYSNYLSNETIQNMPPCSIIKFELEINEWNEITQGIGTMKFFLHP